VDLLDFFEAVVAKPNLQYSAAHEEGFIYVEAGKGKARSKGRQVGPQGGQPADQVGQEPDRNDQQPLPPNKTQVTFHPKVAKDILKLSGDRQDKAEDIFRTLESGQRHSTTHPLHGLKGWDSTKIDSRHIVIHQNRDKGLFVGYVGGQHDYEAAKRRLGSLDLVAFFDEDEHDEEPGPYCSHCDQDGHDESDMHSTCGLCGGGKDAEGAHIGTDDGKCEYAPKKTVEEREDEAYDKLDPSKYCGDGCRSGHASDIAHGVGFHHTFNIDEHDDWHKPRPDARPVPPGSSSPHKEPFARQRSGYEVRNPDDFGLCHYCRAPLKGGLADQMKGLKESSKAAAGPARFFHSSKDPEWSPREGEGYIHLGTRAAAAHRDEGSRVIHEVEVHAKNPMNTPDTPLDDHTANCIGRNHAISQSLGRPATKEDHDPYWEHAPEVAKDAGWKPTHDAVYYRNEVEDPGSISVMASPSAIRKVSSKTAEKAVSVLQLLALKAPDWVREHDWLPSGRIFSAGKGGLDPRLFDTKSRIMLPEVEEDTMGAIDSVWGSKYDNWKHWSRVYLAGSQASEWWGNNDFDVLVGINHSLIRYAEPQFKEMSDDEIDKQLTNELKSALNDEDYQPPWDDDIWHRTFYCNPNSWDIRNIKPYAAYDITNRRWAVDPVQAGPDWSALKLPESLFDEGEALVKQIDAIERLPDPQRTGRGAALWDYLHSDRGRAFSAKGSGVFDPGNAVWKYLDMHPAEPLTRLLDMKREHLKQDAA